jgi:hypothetical protein
VPNSLAVRRCFAAVVCGLVALTACTGGSGSAKPKPVPDTTPQLTTGGALAGAAHPLGAKWDIARADAYKPYLTSLGGGTTFYELTWCDVEPTQGARDFSAPDGVVNTARSVGITVSLKIRVGSCWVNDASTADALGAAPPGAATGGRLEKRLERQAAKRAAKQSAAGKDVSEFPGSLDAYKRFLTDVVHRYGPMGVHEYAIENEVNAPGHWGGSVDQYVQLVTAGATAIRAADPQARVADGGLGSTVYGQAIARDLLAAGRPADAVAVYQLYYVRRFSTRGAALPQATDEASLRAALQTSQAVRNLAYVDATLALATGKVIDTFQLHFYERWDSARNVTTFLGAHLPAGLPVEAWEVGRFWPDAPADEALHASETVKAVTLLLVGGVRRVDWLPLAYNPEGRNATELRFGLVNPDGSVRPSGKAYQLLAAAATDATTQVLNTGPLATIAVAGIALARGDDVTVVAWSDAARTIDKPAPAGAQAVDVNGQPVAWPATGLALSPAPVFIHLAGGVAAATALFAA